MRAGAEGGGWEQRLLTFAQVRVCCMQKWKQYRNQESQFLFDLCLYIEIIKQFYFPLPGLCWYIIFFSPGVRVSPSPGMINLWAWVQTFRFLSGWSCLGCQAKQSPSRRLFSLAGRIVGTRIWQYNRAFKKGEFCWGQLLLSPQQHEGKSLWTLILKSILLDTG